MEGTRKRSLAKTVVWRVICIVVSILTTFAFTGKWDLAVAVGTVTTQYDGTILFS